MDNAIAPIAVVQGAAGADIQHLLADFVLRWQGRARIVGLVEEPQEDVCGCAPGHLRALTSGQRFPIFQDLGPGSKSCALDAVALVEACEQLRRDIAAGCDLVVISKFGKLEAERRSGLLPAFVDAMEAGVPVLTAVAPKFQQSWSEFAAPFFIAIPAERDAIDTWWAVRWFGGA
jgi:hypothetical protein